MRRYSLFAYSAQCLVLERLLGCDGIEENDIREGFEKGEIPLGSSYQPQWKRLYQNVFACSADGMEDSVVGFHNKLLYITSLLCCIEK